MAQMIFTDREMQRAWRINFQASRHLSRSNAHRLLLFYSIECGLKAVLMKRQSASCTSFCDEIAEAQHNINKLLDYLSAAPSLKLSASLQMEPIQIKGNKIERKLDAGKINQAWRYGGCLIDTVSSCSAPSTIEDDKVEKQLMRISEWIRQELNA
jgi:hypothetical protein